MLTEMTPLVVERADSIAPVQELNNAVYHCVRVEVIT